VTSINNDGYRGGTPNSSFDLDLEWEVDGNEFQHFTLAAQWSSHPPEEQRFRVRIYLAGVLGLLGKHSKAVGSFWI
jgi:hypothetical protein